MPTPPRVLIVATPGPEATALCHLLAAAGHDTLLAADVEAALAQLERAGADVVLMAAHGRTRQDVARLETVSDGARVVVIVSDAADASRDECRLGGFDVVPGSGDVKRLLHAVERAVSAGQMQRELASLRARLGERAQRALVGKSAPIEQVRELIGRAAGSRMTVLVTGEAGTGKDVVARLIHDLSDRAGEPFLTLRCAGADPGALETELFGTSGGAGERSRSGLLVETRGGTLVLDEYLAIPPAVRARIAAAVAGRSVGEGRPVDARLVLTLREQAGPASVNGRADGPLGRLPVLPIALPPLRERRRDIPLLVQHFHARLRDETGVEPEVIGSEAMMELIGRPWPGNVRELQHFVERGARDPMARPMRDPFDAGLTLDALEREYILHVLAQVKGHQSRAAERLGIDRRTLYRKLKEYREHGDARVA